MTTVSCPDSVDEQAATSFDCDVSGESGLTGAVTVTLKDDSGTSFEYEGETHAQGSSTKVSGSSSTS